MDVNKKIWLEMVSSLMSAKNSKWITDVEYVLYKEKLKNWFDSIDNHEEKYTDYSSYDDSLSKDDISDFVDSFYEKDDDVIAKEMSELERADLYHILEYYDWDSGFSIPEMILNHPDCDMALAMEIFDLADGYTFIEKCYLNKNKPSNYNVEWWDFCTKLFQDLGDGKYKMDDASGKIPVGYQIALLKQGIVNNLTKDCKFLFE